MPEFTFTIGSEQLIKGLRPSKRAPRNVNFLVESKGGVGRDGVLAAIDELTRIDTSSITDVFPFPQIFVFTNFVIVCSSTTIYEWDGSALVSKLVTTAGSTWEAEAFYEYVYLSNGIVSVVRSSDTGEYTESTLYKASSVMNFNGQVLIGAPNVTIPGASLTYSTDSFSLAVTQHGSWS